MKKRNYKKINKKKYRKKGGSAQLSQNSSSQNLETNHNRNNLHNQIKSPGLPVYISGTLKEMGEEQRKSMAEQNGNQKGVLSNIIGNDGQFNMNKMKNMMNSSGIGNDDAIKKAEMGMKKAEQLQSSLLSMNKTPAQHLLDYMLYTLYTLAGIFIYYPSFLVNLPDTNLEDIIPTNGGCKILFGNELTCKRKLKCFFKKCSLFEDPIGYKLEKEIEKQRRGKKKRKGISKKKQKIQLGGGKSRKIKRITHSKHKSKFLNKYLKNVPKQIKQSLYKKYTNDIIKQIRLYKKMMKGTGKYKFIKGGDVFTNKLNQFAGSSLQKNGMKHIMSELKGQDPLAQATSALGPTGSKLATKAIDYLLDDESERLEQSTCINQTKNPDGTTKTNHIICDSKPYVDYKEGEAGKDVLRKILFGRTPEEREKETSEKSMKRVKDLLSFGKKEQSGGSMNPFDGLDMEFVIKEVTKDFINMNLEQSVMFKMILSYKMLKILFDNEVQQQDIVNYDKSMKPLPYGVNVAFPWKTNNFFTSPEERRKCLFAHLTKTDLGADFKSNDLYDKCFICKNCTLANTSFKAWENIVNNLFISKKKEFNNIIQDLYNILKKYFTFKTLPRKQYYLISLLTMHLIHPLFDINKTNINIEDNEGNQFELRDLILGIPILQKNQDLPNAIREQIKETFIMLKMMNIEDILYKCYYNMVYRYIIHEGYNEKQLNRIKQAILNNYNLLYGRQQILLYQENPIHIENLQQYQIVHNMEEVQSRIEDEEIAENSEELYNLNKLISNKINDIIPLYKLVLNRLEFDKPEIYRNSENMYIKHFEDIIEKLNVMDQDVKDFNINS